MKQQVDQDFGVNAPNEYLDSVDMVKNPPTPEFLSQLEQEPMIIETYRGVKFALRHFTNNWDAFEETAQEDTDKPAPIIFFTQWGVGISSMRGQYDVYGLLKHVEPHREVLTIDLPGIDAAGQPTLSWVAKANYKNVGEELAYVLAEAGYHEASFHVAGVSHGGNVAIGLADALGDRAKSVTIVSSPGASPTRIKKFLDGFSKTEAENLQKAIAGSDEETANVIREIEASQINTQEKSKRSFLSLIKFGLLMSRDSLAKGIKALDPDTVLSVFCGSKEAILDWRRQLEVVRQRNAVKSGSSNITIVGGSGPDYGSVVASHARLAANRLEPSAQIALTIKRLEGK